MQMFGIACDNDVFHLSVRNEAKMIALPDILFTLNRRM